MRDERGGTERHSTLQSLPLDADALARRSERWAPRRSLQGEILHVALGAANGGATFGEIATMLHERFGDRFATRQSALDYVTDLGELWAR